MMMKTSPDPNSTHFYEYPIFAYTETDYQPEYYPGFVSLNQREDGSFALSVRSRGDQGSAEVVLQGEELDRMFSLWQGFREGRG